MVCWVVLLLLSLPAHGEPGLSLAPVFTNGMVLQRDRPALVWGRGKPSNVVTVQFAGQQVKAAIDEDGAWRAELKPMPASTDNRALRITSANETIEVKDVLVGEVWLLAGQSNMDFQLGSATGGAQYADKIAADPTIRLLDPPKQVPSGARAWPLEVCEQLTPASYFGRSEWARLDRQAAARFSAVGAVFGIRLSESLDVPIGLIDLSVGGSTTESWVPREAILNDPDLSPLEHQYLDTVMVQDFVHTRPRQHLANWLKADRPGSAPEHPYRAGFLYEAAIESVSPLPIAGVLWYQGESNAEDVAPHNKLFRLAVQSWRKAFASTTLPVLCVQLPELNREYWPEFREAQQQLAQSIEHTALAVSLGSGHPSDVHPRDKAPVGDRLARLALNRIYGQDIEDSGPVLNHARRVGAAMQLTFDHVTAGLDLRLPGNDEPRRDQPTAFWIAGEDKIFFPAYLAEKQGNTLWLNHPEVSEPAAVRYAWEANVKPTLYNGEELPAAPFRTDDWQPIRIACVGDSITHGTGTRNPDSESYPAQLSHLVGPLFDVRRFGVPGSSVVDGLIQQGTGWNRSYIRQRAFHRSMVFEPDVVIINLGINDVVKEHFNIDLFVADYLALINAYRGLASKPTVLIWGKLAPLFPGQAFYESPRLALIQKALDRVVEKTGVEVIDMHTPLIDAGQSFPDKIHPNAQGAKLIAEHTRDKLKKIKLPIAGESE